MGMTLINIEDYLEKRRSEINTVLIEQVTQAGPPEVRNAVKYTLEAGGKRLRPVLFLAVAETLGGNDEELLLPACAMEYVHTYSLIHDDLPAMDNSALRRGKPTCHCIYGEAVAILAGDALLTMAFEVLARYGLKRGREDDAIKIVLELTEAAGINGMIGGQVLDIGAEGSTLTGEEAENVAAMKTGALIRAAVRCGAIAAKASPFQVEHLTIYGEKIGLAFQLADDLLDCESTTEALGKPAGSDRLNRKATYPFLIGVEVTKQRIDALFEQAIVALKKLDCSTLLLEALANRMLFRSK